MRAELSSRVKGAEGACPLLARRAGASRPPGSPLCGLWSGPLLPAPTSRAEGSLQLGSHRVLPWWFLDSDPSAWAASDRGDTGDTLTSRREWSPSPAGPHASDGPTARSRPLGTGRRVVPCRVRGRLLRARSSSRDPRIWEWGGRKLRGAGGEASNWEEEKGILRKGNWELPG